MKNQIKRLEYGLSALATGRGTQNWNQILEGLSAVREAMREAGDELPDLCVSKAYRDRMEQLRWNKSLGADSSGWLDTVTRDATALFPRPNRLSGEKWSEKHRDQVMEMLPDVWNLNKLHNPKPVIWTGSINSWLNRQDNRWLDLWLNHVGSPDDRLNEKDSVLSKLLGHHWPNGFGWKKWFTHEHGGPAVKVWPIKAQEELWTGWAIGWVHAFDGKNVSEKVQERRWNDRAEPLRQLNLHTAWRPSPSWLSAMKAMGKTMASERHKDNEERKAIKSWEEWPTVVESMLAKIERTDLHRHLKRQGVEPSSRIQNDMKAL